MSEYYFLNSRELLISMACIFCWIISPVCDKQAQTVHSFSFCKSCMKRELLLLCLLLLHLEIPEIKIILLYYQNSDLLSIQYPLPLQKCYTSINHLKINFQGQWSVLNRITLTSVNFLCVGGCKGRNCSYPSLPVPVLPIYVRWAWAQVVTEHSSPRTQVLWGELMQFHPHRSVWAVRWLLRARFTDLWFIKSLAAEEPGVQNGRKQLHY